MGTVFGIILGLSAWTLCPCGGDWPDYIFTVFACLGSTYMLAVEPLRGVKAVKNENLQKFQEIRENTGDLLKQYVSRGGDPKDVDQMSSKAIEKEADRIISHLREKKEKGKKED